MLHQQNEIIAERYKVVKTLCKYNPTKTYIALDTKNIQLVVLKVFSIDKNAKSEVLKSLFERKAKILLSLGNHPFLANYLDYFEIDTEKKRHFYFVRELVKGRSLYELIADGSNPENREAQVKKIATQLLSIVDYLHSRSPAMLHGNIKLNNIIYNENGQVYLVDFDGIRGGFFIEANFAKRKPLEQIMSKAVPASDLYSIGYCLILLLSRKSPAKLSEDLMRLDSLDQMEFNLADWVDYKISADFYQWLTKMVADKVEDRFSSASEAAKALQTKSRSENSTLVANKPTKKIEIDCQPNHLKYRIFLGSYSSAENKLTSGAAKAALAIVGLFTMPELAVFGICIWLFSLSCHSEPQSKKLTEFSSQAIQKYIALEINSQTFCLEKTTGFGLRGEVKIERKIGKTADIHWINNLGEHNESVIIATRCNNREHQYAFGDRQLNHNEAIAIVDRIKKFIENVS